MTKPKKSGKKGSQQGESPGGNKTATIKAEKPKIIEENPNTGKSIDNNKKDNKKERPKPKPTKKKKSKKTGSISNLFSIRRLFLFYILVVFFWCNGKSQEQCNSYEEALCFNGISQYILKHDYFKYIEPAINSIKQNVDVYGKKALNTASDRYEIHVRPHADPLFETAQPYLKNARELSTEYIYIPVTKGLTKVQEFYDDNAREHVDNYYDQAVKFSVPYINQIQEHATSTATYTYEQALEYNKNTIKPWYHKKVIPFVVDIMDKAILYYETKIIPAAHHTLEFIKKIYYEKIVPAYHDHIEPRVSALLELIQKTKPEKEPIEEKKKAKEEADKKAKIEAEKKAKAEVDKKAKIEAEKKAKEEADKRAEAEKKAKEEANKRVKAEAEKKAKEEADKKAKIEAEKKAKEEADKKAKIEAEKKAKAEVEVIRNTFNKELPIIKENLTLALDNYEKKATSITQNNLREVEDKISTLKIFGSECLVELKEFIEKIRDDTKDRKLRLNKIMDLAKKLIENTKETSQEFVEFSKKLFNDLEEKTLNELKKEFDLNFTFQISKIYNLINNQKIDDKLKTDIETKINSITQEFDEGKFNAFLRVQEVFAIINNKIDLLISTKDDIIKDIYSYVKAEKESLKNEKDNNINSDTSNIDNNQIPVQQVKEMLLDKEKVKDTVLEKLKAKHDLVLDRLKEKYELFKAGKEPVIQIQPINDDDDEYYDDDDDDDEDDGDDDDDVEEIENNEYPSED